MNISKLSLSSASLHGIREKENALFPKKRNMIEIPASIYNERDSVRTVSGFRILQFNILADGLSGLRKDMGAFSRVNMSILEWEKRRISLLKEIVQYDPDVITLQECDHFHDFFMPELDKRGYVGFFAPKPVSACLEVSSKGDGCAMFFRRSMFEIVSVETMTYAVRKSDVQQLLRKHRESLPLSLSKIKASTSSFLSLLNHESIPRSQNQVAIIVNGYFLSGKKSQKIPLVVATTHLKASKSIEGEIFRLLECKQLMTGLQRNVESLQQMNAGQHHPAILLAGDMNATPDDRCDVFGYNCEVYRHITTHPTIKLRSVLNDDLPEALAFRQNTSVLEEKQKIWTTWKSRWKGKPAEELVVKHCIDYVLYSPLCSDDATNSIGDVCTLRPKAVAEVLKDNEVGNSLLPSVSYPSDHVSIVADFDINVYKKRG